VRQALRVVRFCLAHHLDHGRACGQRRFHDLGHGGWWTMHSRKRAHVPVPLPLEQSTCLFGSHGALASVQHACSSHSLVQAIDQGDRHRIIGLFPGQHGTGQRNATGVQGARVLVTGGRSGRGSVLCPTCSTPSSLTSADLLTVVVSSRPLRASDRAA
jgi:hypothetical protein